MTISGNQPSIPSNADAHIPSSDTPKHASNVDPNQLLLMLPDLQKKARALENKAKNADITHDKVINDAQNKALADTAKSLLSFPNLDPGSKAALDKWVAQIENPQSQGDDAQTAGTGVQNRSASATGQTNTGTATGQTTGQAATTGQPATGQTATGQTATGQTAGQPGSAGTTTDPTAFGGDPNALLTDDPKATNQEVKNLGKLASGMASSQGGKLTQEQVSLLTDEANVLFSAPANKMTDADKAVLLSFLTQLGEFPLKDDPNAPDAPKTNTSSSSNTGDAQNTRSAKNAADTSNLAMDELGLGENLNKLGQQALTMVKGNNGKLSEKEAEQLKMAAEELIAGGADGDDLKALQNFIQSLMTFPKVAGRSATGSGGPDTPLLLKQQGLDPKMMTLSQFANSMLKAQGGALTQPEVEMLKSMANEMMADLSDADQAVLKQWLGTLAGVKTNNAPPVNVFPESMMFHETKGKGNPYMQPGIMAMLAPILSEIMKINNDIIKQSSKLKQESMKLLVAMAKEAFNFAIAAGNAKVAQLQKEAMMHLSLGISQCVQAGMSIASFAMTSKAQSGFGKDATASKVNSKMQNWAKGEGEVPKPSPATLATREQSLKAANGEVYNSDGSLKNPKGGPGHEQVAKYLIPKHNTNTANKNDQFPKGTDFNKLSFGEQAEVMNSAATRTQTSGITAITGAIDHMGKATDSFIQAGFTMAKQGDVLAEASANAHKDMISQLMQLIQGTIQSASDEMGAAQKNFESFSQLYKDFANTITQAIYRSG